MNVKEIMTAYHRIPFGTTVSKAARMMDAKMAGAVIIDKKGEAVGVITERDLLRKVLAKGVNPSKKKVEKIMGSPVYTISEGASIAEASQMMDKKRVRRLAVVDGKGNIIGKVSANGISRRVPFVMFKRLAGRRETVHRSAVVYR